MIGCAKGSRPTLQALSPRLGASAGVPHQQAQQCARGIINAFDNTIAYVLLTCVIRLLEKRANIDSSLLYLSDHGESLEENGM